MDWKILSKFLEYVRGAGINPYEDYWYWENQYIMVRAGNVGPDVRRISVRAYNVVSKRNWEPKVKDELNEDGGMYENGMEIQH